MTLASAPLYTCTHIVFVCVHQTAQYIMIVCFVVYRYQLSPEQVSLEYRDQYSSLMKRNGVKIKLSDFEPTVAAGNTSNPDSAH